MFTGLKSKINSYRHLVMFLMFRFIPIGGVQITNIGGKYTTEENYQGRNTIPIIPCTANVCNH